MTSVTEVRVERRTDGAFADTPTPRLSWVVTHAGPWRQAEAQVRLDGDAVAVLATGESSFVDWPFPPVQPRSRHQIEVRVRSTDGVWTPWSAPVELRTVFLARGEWQAPFIALAEPDGVACPGLLRREFDLSGEPVEAILYASAQGVYQASINGTDVDDAVLKPGWTVYQRRMVHECTDVTDLLRPGRNCLGLRIAGGWWTEEFGFYGQARRIYGDQPAAACQLYVRFADGSAEWITSGSDWVGASAGPLVSSGLYAGERVDARRAVPGWDRPGFDDAGWSTALTVASDVVPEAAIAEPVRRVEEVPVREVLTSPSGATILDFGQNLVGRLRITVRGPAGHVITVRHGEMLDHGELETSQLRDAKATDEFVLSGGDDAFEPEFTFHGFRYAEVTGWPGDLDTQAICAVVIGSDMRRTGWFDSSDARLNRFHENVVWGMRGNFLSIPTDCPQRDERLGWTGDITVFSPTASSLFDCDAFLASWLRDVAAEQEKYGGSCPIVVPQVLPDEGRPAAAWGDAATIVPTVLYDRFGDERALAEQYPSARSWVETVLPLTGENLLWQGMEQYGDWMDPTAPPERPEEAATPTEVVATAYFYRSAFLVARAAALLGHESDSAYYGELAKRIRRAWVTAYLEEDQLADTQTGCALAIMFDLVDEPLRQELGDRLAALVQQAGARVATGFVGTPIVTDALTVTGHEDIAGQMLLQTAPPSWLYAVEHGATTVWERWTPLLADGNPDPDQVTSFNHYAFGAVADWMHRSVAGLAPDLPGYRRIRVAPVPLAGLEHASVRRLTPYGEARVGWRREGDEILVHALIPANTTASVSLPGRADAFEVASGEHSWRVSSEVGLSPSAPRG